ncbi:MAG: DUF4242 domain-containing protein [Chitinophagaceae bacterium]|nr:MAG: DUF4242 domain-containing protein [Chitinophagaceae bacterium]
MNVWAGQQSVDKKKGEGVGGEDIPPLLWRGAGGEVFPVKKSTFIPHAKTHPMPIYMDVHSVPGVRARQVAEAHRLDLAHQNDFGCTCMTYWIDETRESVFCLIDAPDKDAVRELHRKAHGLIPGKIIEVSSSIVQSFLGRIYDPEEVSITNDGLRVFADPAFRVLLLAQTVDPAMLCHCIGKEKATSLFREHNQLLRTIAAEMGGLEAEHPGEGLIFSFPSASRALTCARTILNELPASLAASLNSRLSVSAGEAVGSSTQLFGDAIRGAQNLAMLHRTFRLAVDGSVKDILAKEDLSTVPDLLSLNGPDELLLRQIFQTLDIHASDEHFDADAFARALALSKSQLYRKCVEITGYSPNTLLKEYRLRNARWLLRNGLLSIAQVAFDTGFTSASYFTKCFKKEYGLLPGEYRELL